MPENDASDLMAFITNAGAALQPNFDATFETAQTAAGLPVANVTQDQMIAVLCVVREASLRVLSQDPAAEPLRSRTLELFERLAPELQDSCSAWIDDLRSSLDPMLRATVSNMIATYARQQLASGALTGPQAETLLNRAVSIAVAGGEHGLCRAMLMSNLRSLADVVRARDARLAHEIEARATGK
jgi:hypothetical protein